MKWCRVNRNTVGDAKDAPPIAGVGIAQILCPHFNNDGQTTLNYISIDGTIVGVRLCHNGQQRDANLRDARRYL